MNLGPICPRMDGDRDAYGPNAMVNDAGDVFYPDGLWDARWFEHEHGARPVDVARFADWLQGPKPCGPIPCPAGGPARPVLPPDWRQRVAPLLRHLRLSAPFPLSPDQQATFEAMQEEVRAFLARLSAEAQRAFSSMARAFAQIADAFHVVAEQLVAPYRALRYARRARADFRTRHRHLLYRERTLARRRRGRR